MNLEGEFIDVPDNYFTFLQVWKYFKRKGGNPTDDCTITLDTLICGMWLYVYELQDFYHFK